MLGGWADLIDEHFLNETIEHIRFGLVPLNFSFGNCLKIAVIFHSSLSNYFEISPKL